MCHTWPPKVFEFNTINNLHIKQYHRMLSVTHKTSMKFHVLRELHKGVLCIFTKNKTKQTCLSCSVAPSRFATPYDGVFSFIIIWQCNKWIRWIKVIDVYQCNGLDNWDLVLTLYWSSWCNENGNELALRKMILTLCNGLVC